MEKISLLKTFFGHEGFRTGQEAMVDAILSGRDVLGVMPTGAGKSVCYQLPALMLPGVTLVVSPLISLMKDQVGALLQSGVPAAYINSSLSQEEYFDVIDRVRRGAYKLLYVAPERLLTDGFLNLAKKMRISMLAVDEAHCVSQWGQDFRPSYLQIPEFIRQLDKRPVLGAFTATATRQVKEDIARLLLLEDPLQITTGFDRPNLFFRVEKPKNKSAWLLKFLEERPGESGIVYCATRKLVEAVSQELSIRGIPAVKYHAGLPDEERIQNQEDFVNDTARVMVATNAFGMGIDKSNVSFVVHYNMPKDMESYYQEAGRAGRDGSAAQCVLLFAPGDVSTAKYLILNSQDNETLTEEEQELVRRRDLNRLSQMAAYCRTHQCLRAHLVRYFGEDYPEGCGSCGNCKSGLESRDITLEAQKILSAVARAERKYRRGVGVNSIILMLSGSKERRVSQLGLDKLPTYGIMKDVDRKLIRDYMDFLIQEEYLCTQGDEYPVVRLTGNARGVLSGEEKVTYLYRKTEKPESLPARSAGAVESGGPLFEELRALRRKLAQEERIPPYMIFSNATLEDMARRRPGDMAGFMEVSGVGEVKAGKYGRAFLDKLREWEENEQEGQTA
ncbi:DNA helicase RecQ [Acutalibacter sp. 1XD8-36]|uniref:DNA helicase RecQ n=1 Tax=Acutalibacter sp. 1XD8-36 TaxID=2320852 RepID=UPI001411DEF0|nr:DNA helicase RecQ [Acutalibacter sp. 1XD8-36]NBJ88333.1 DNA helicase RecQ [Acutalibacter sp. 1XD8-36]